MNYSYFEGKDADPLKISEAAQTLPFFSDYRLIVIEESGLFKSQSELGEYIKELPESTVIIFVETEVDKRNKLFKLLKEHGTISEMNGLDEKNLKLFVASLLEQNGKKIPENLVVYFLDKTGADMVNICNEIEKLVSFALERTVITQEDIDTVVTTQISGKIFQMIDAIGSKQSGKALTLYYELLSVREKPMSILYLLTRHFNILLQVKDLQARGFAAASISEMAGIPPFSVNKYVAQAKNFTIKKLKEALEACTDIEEQVKTGRMLEKIGVEMLIITFSKR
jgi:DNA polymerase-3 subunit delta